jgi:hypothetical protein
MSFFQNREQEGKTGPVWALVPMGRREDISKGCRRVNVVEILCTYENEKMRPVKTFPGTQGMGRIKENCGGGEFEFNCDIL